MTENTQETGTLDIGVVERGGQFLVKLQLGSQFILLAPEVGQKAGRTLLKAGKRAQKEAQAAKIWVPGAE